MNESSVLGGGGGGLMLGSLHKVQNQEHLSFCLFSVPLSFPSLIPCALLSCCLSFSLLVTTERK